MEALQTAILALIAIIASYLLYRRLQLSMAKHPSLTGHAKLAKKLAGLLPGYSVTWQDFFTFDEPPEAISESRKQAFSRLQDFSSRHAPDTTKLASNLEPGIADMQFTRQYRVPFMFAAAVTSKLAAPGLVARSAGTKVQDLDGNWRYDVSGSYGVNVFGYDFYKQCMKQAQETVADLGPVLGSYHPCIVDNVRRLKEISGLDQVSFHMSGTEAVMQAVRLARYHTGRSHVVKFSGAYHGWWDGVQPGIGNPGRAGDVYTLREMSEHTLRVLRTKNNIACVLINPIQIMHPNKNAPGDSILLGQRTDASVSREEYAGWLNNLRKVCNERGIVLILDEVFVGFRIAYRGAQEYFGVKADLVTYGKTLGGGLPIGVLCGREALMKRYRDDHPADICFARGTFNSHPLVMAAMNQFLRHIEQPDVQAAYEAVDQIWNERFQRLNQQFQAAGLPIEVTHFASIGMVCYQSRSLYNWMYQFYLQEAGIGLSWVGTGRLIFSHNYSDAEFDEVSELMVRAAKRMQQDGWFWESNQPVKSKLKQAKLMCAALLRQSP